MFQKFCIFYYITEGRCVLFQRLAEGIEKGDLFQGFPWCLPGNFIEITEWCHFHDVVSFGDLEDFVGLFRVEQTHMDGAEAEVPRRKDDMFHGDTAIEHKPVTLVCGCLTTGEPRSDPFARQYR